MRKVIELQMEFWKKDITQIESDLKSRDEIPRLLIELQYIYSTPKNRAEVFKILKRIVPIFRRSPLSKSERETKGDTGICEK